MENQIVQLDERHMIAIQGLVAGTPVRLIAEKLGVAEGTIHMWKRMSAFQDEFAATRRALEEGTKELVKAMYLQNVPEAVATQLTLMRESENDRVKLDAAKDLQDRAGFKPVEKVQHAHAVVHIDEKNLAFAKDVAREINERRAPKIVSPTGS